MVSQSSVSQLIVNWNSWYGLGFAQGVEMLAREGHTLPECTRLQDGTETPRVMVSPDSNAGPAHPWRAAELTRGHLCQ